MTDSSRLVDPAPLPRAEFAFPGLLRDALVAAILDGRKVATTSLAIEYAQSGEPLPKVGERSTVVDSINRPVAVIEVTSVRVVPLGEVDDAHARDEGEGYTAVTQWRAAHEEFWHSPEMRSYLGDAAFTVDDTTRVVLERFRVIADLRPA
ncbi:ASCH domain-containing protein [Microbispora sp. ATCC PTA-5024]|uniref:ASCH domain-containing protein n=1 Tax=Microbispora sp. ATCC PTA-5024 TaxID=316330 RepID=UPI000559D5D7|nr:ASCH domain-containing protein [Microbispora sp. ATCC PTA-5024]